MLRVLVLLLAASLLLGSVSMAAGNLMRTTAPTLVYDGEAGAFTLENVPGNDLFSNFKNLMPGDERTQDVNVVVKNIQTPTTLFLTSTPDEATKKALAPLTLTVTQDGGDLGEFAHSVLADVPLGVFREDGSTTLHVKLTVPTTVGNELQAAQASLRWDFIARHTITIRPATISSYVGGVSSNDSGAPTLRFHVTLPNGVIWDNDRSITMTLHESGREPITMTPRKVEGSESYYCFPTLERGLEFVDGSQVLEGDYLTLTNRLDSGNRGGAYAVGLNQDPPWYITAVGESGREYAVEVLTGDARVYVRYVSSDEEMIDAPSSALTKVVSDPGKVNTIVDAGENGIYRKAVAVIDEDAVYYTNGKASGLGSFTMGKDQGGDIGGLKPLVALLFDDTVSLSDGLTDQLIEAKMIEHAGHAKSCGADRDYFFDGWNYNFRYLDLVNYNDGNAWVSTDAETTIYWPYPIQALNDPGGYTSYEYQILHYQGMARRVTRAQDIDQWEKETLHRDDGAVKVYSEDLTLTPQGLKFTLEDIEGSEDNFSPFVLMWRKKASGGHGGGSRPVVHTPTPSPSPSPSPDASASLTPDPSASPSASGSASPAPDVSADPSPAPSAEVTQSPAPGVLETPASSPDGNESLPSAAPAASDGGTQPGDGAQPSGGQAPEVSAPSAPSAVPAASPATPRPAKPPTPTGTTSSTSNQGTQTLPQTGQQWWPVLAMAAGGLALLILGLNMGKKGKHEA